MQIEALILRRCYPVPVTLSDLRAAHASAFGHFRVGRPAALVLMTAALKDVTGALDEVYAVVDGREVRVTTVSGPGVEMRERLVPGVTGAMVWDFLDHAARAGYWQHPHEVRVDFETLRPTHDEVARAVAVGQMALERGEGTWDATGGRS